MSKNEPIVKSWMSEKVYQLLLKAGKSYTLELKEMALKDSMILDLLVRVFLTDEKKLCWHAGWTLYKIADTHKNLLEKYLASIIKKLPDMKYDSQCHAAFRIIRNYDISDENLQGILVDIGIKFIRNKKYPANLKYFSILIIEKIANYYPELINELVLTIEEALPYWKTSYIIKLGKKKLKEYGN